MTFKVGDFVLCEVVPVTEGEAYCVVTALQSNGDGCCDPLVTIITGKMITGNPADKLYAHWHPSNLRLVADPPDHVIAEHARMILMGELKY